MVGESWEAVKQTENLEASVGIFLIDLHYPLRAVTSIIPGAHAMAHWALELWALGYMGPQRWLGPSLSAIQLGRRGEKRPPRDLPRDPINRPAVSPTPAAVCATTGPPDKGPVAGSKIDGPHRPYGGSPKAVPPTGCRSNGEERSTLLVNWQRLLTESLAGGGGDGEMSPLLFFFCCCRCFIRRRGLCCRLEVYRETREVEGPLMATARDGRLLL